MPRDPQDEAEDRRDWQEGRGIPRSLSDQLADEAADRWETAYWGRG